MNKYIFKLNNQKLFFPNSKFLKFVFYLTKLKKKKKSFPLKNYLDSTELFISLVKFILKQQFKMKTEQISVIYIELIIYTVFNEEKKDKS